MSTQKLANMQLIAALFVTAQRRKQLKYPSMDKWTNKCDIYMKIKYSAIKGNSAWIHAATWVILENNMLVKKLVTENYYHMISFI